MLKSIVLATSTCTIAWLLRLANCFRMVVSKRGLQNRTSHWSTHEKNRCCTWNSRLFLLSTTVDHAFSDIHELYQCLLCFLLGCFLEEITILLLAWERRLKQIHKVLKPFSVVDIRRPQAFQAVRRAEDVTIEDYMIGRLLLSATDAFGCI